MTSNAAHEPSNDGQAISLFTIASVILRRRRLIAAFTFFFFAIGLVLGLTSTRLYRSSAVFIPNSSDPAPSAFAAAAGQLGIRLPSGDNRWGASMYVELLQSRSLLESIVLDSVRVAEMGNRRLAVTDLLEANGATEAVRVNTAIRLLQDLIMPREVKPLNGVEVSVSTPWPSVSLWIVETLVQGVNRFNLQTQRMHAEAEREFVETQAAEAEGALRTAEDKLQTFLERNRAISGSPDLAFERDRLQREVNVRQQVYTSLLQSREEARLREVRNTPVITVLEVPRLPVTREPRRSLQKAVLGGIVGGMLGILIALLADGFAKARRSPSQPAGEFFQLLQEISPRFSRWFRQ